MRASTPRRLKALEAKIQATMDAAALRQSQDAEFDRMITPWPWGYWTEYRRIGNPPQTLMRRVRWQEWMGPRAQVYAFLDAMEALLYDIDDKKRPVTDVMLFRAKSLQAEYLAMLERCPPHQRDGYLLNSEWPLLMVTTIPF